MSKPITLTERERAVFAHMARTLGNGTASHDIIVSNALLHFLEVDFQARFAAPAESASPPRVPVGITGPVLPYESGSGQPTGAAKQGDDYYAHLIAAEREAGYRAGIEAAAQWHSEIAKEHRRLGNTDWSAAHEGFAATMRALADKPAPDPLLPGLQHIMAYMIREPWTADTIRTFIQCEIAARKGG